MIYDDNVQYIAFLGIYSSVLYSLKGPLKIDFSNFLHIFFF